MPILNTLSKFYYEMREVRISYRPRPYMCVKPSTTFTELAYCTPPPLNNSYVDEILMWSLNRIKYNCWDILVAVFTPINV